MLIACQVGKWESLTFISRTNTQHVMIIYGQSRIIAPISRMLRNIMLNLHSFKF